MDTQQNTTAPRRLKRRADSPFCGPWLGPPLRRGDGLQQGEVPCSDRRHHSVPLLLLLGSQVAAFWHSLHFPVGVGLGSSATTPLPASPPPPPPPSPP